MRNLFGRTNSGPEKADEKPSQFEIFHLQSVFDAIEDVVWILDTEHRILLANKATKLLFGLDPEEVVGHLCCTIVHNTNSPIPECPFLRLKLSGAREQMEMQSGDKWYQVTVDPLLNNQGELEGVVHIIRDITTIHAREETLDEQKQKLHELISNAPVGTHLYQLQEEDRLVFIGANPAADQILGIDHNQFIGKTIEEAFPPLADSEIPASYKKVARTGEPYNTEQFSYSDDQGITGAYDLKTFGIGEKRIVVFFQDITERKKAELALRDSERKFRDIFNFASVGIYQSSPDGSFITANVRLAEILGYPSMEELMKASLEKDIYKDSKERQRLISLYTPGNSAKDIEVEWKRADGSPIWVSMSAHAVRDDHGEILYFEGFITDITPRKEYEAELQKAKEKAEESDRLKSAFLANMSHEIRTPMNGIIGLASMMEEPDISEEEKKRFLRIIHDNSFQLLKIIDDLVDISKIESGQVEVQEKEVCLNFMLDSLSEIYLPLAEKKGLSLKLNKAIEETECCVITDESKVRQILQNLINNALKFSTKGDIVVGYDLQSDHIEFTVKDSGIGIPPEMKDFIFDRFRQAELSIAKQYGGTGLGLSISRAFTESLGGRIWFDSTPGAGTSFYFTVPLKPAGKDIRKDKPHGSSPPTPGNIIVLIVEDELANFEYLDVVLRRLASKTLHAQTAQEAMDLFRNHPEINLVLMDVKLPDRNGYDITREMLASRPDLPIIAQTAYALSDEREKALNAGCVDYLPKPIRKETLIHVIGEYMS